MVASEVTSEIDQDGRFDIRSMSLPPNPRKRPRVGGKGAVRTCLEYSRFMPYSRSVNMATIVNQGVSPAQRSSVRWERKLTELLESFTLWEVAGDAQSHRI